MRGTIQPVAGAYYHENDTGFSFRGDGAKWVRAWTPASLHSDRPFPGFDVPVQVPDTAWFRLVFGTARIRASGQNHAEIRFLSQNDQGVYEEVGRLATDAASNLAASERMFVFVALGGRSYKFERDALQDSVEAVLVYNYAEF